jgi:hypothetical protein
MPEDWAADLQLTQEQIGNAVPLGIAYAYHLGVAIADYLRPHLLARAEIEKSEVIAPIASPPPQPHSRSKLSLREVRLGGFSRLAVRRIEWKRWSRLQRLQLHCQAKSDAEGSAALAGSRIEGYREQPRWLLRRAATL